MRSSKRRRAYNRVETRPNVQKHWRPLVSGIILSINECSHLEGLDVFSFIKIPSAREVEANRLSFALFDLKRNVMCCKSASQHFRSIQAMSSGCYKFPYIHHLTQICQHPCKEYTRDRSPLSSGES